MTPEQYLAWWDAVEAKARLGAKAAADAMARYIAERTANETLGQQVHSPGAYHRARPGAPPSRSSGSLQRGMYWTPGGNGLRSRSYAGNNARHARVMENGCVLTPTRKEHVGWKDTGRADNPSGWWRHRSVTLTPHPFLGPTVEDAIDDGELQQAAIDAFRPYDP